MRDAQIGLLGMRDAQIGLLGMRDTRAGLWACVTLRTIGHA